VSNLPSSAQTIFKAVIHTEEEGGYWAEVPDLPGCFTQGTTLDEIYHNLTEAIACHLGIDAVRSPTVPASFGSADTGRGSLRARSPERPGFP